MAIREQSFHQRLVGHRLDLPAIARRAEASRLLQVDQPVGLPGLGQTLRGAAHLFELVAAVGDQQQWIGAAALLDQDRAVAVRRSAWTASNTIGRSRLGITRQASCPRLR